MNSVPKGGLRGRGTTCFLQQDLVVYRVRIADPLSPCSVPNEEREVGHRRRPIPMGYPTACCSPRVHFAISEIVGANASRAGRFKKAW